MSDTIYVAHITEVVIAHGTRNKRPLLRIRRCPLSRVSFPTKVEKIKCRRQKISKIKVSKIKMPKKCFSVGS
jgi:hypothetical protein